VLNDLFTVLLGCKKFGLFGEPLWLTSVEQGAIVCAETTRGLDTYSTISVPAGTNFPPWFAPAFLSRVTPF